MKRFFTFLAAAMVAVLPVLATQPEPTPASIETKEYRLSGFDGLSVSSIYQVDLSKSSRHSVKVEAPDFLMPYLNVEVSGGTLKLGLKELPKDLRRRLETGRNKIRATVTMPELVSLKMSGAARLNASGEFSSRSSVEIGMSGAAHAEGLKIQASGAKIGASGAAGLNMKGHFDQLDLNMSGSAKASLTIDARSASLLLSGAAGISNEGSLRELRITASGAARMELKGSSDELEIMGSGAARLKMEGAPVRSARISMSGSAGAVVDVRETLSVTLSGAASLRYHAGDRLRITSQTVSRGASLSSF